MRRLRAMVPWVLILILLAVAAPQWALAGPIEDARQLIEQAKYDEVDGVLKPLLSQKEPPAEALRISLDAALAAGRVVTAQRRITRLLRANGSTDAGLLFLGAEVAQRTGDERIALARYLAHANRAGGKTPELESTLRHLLVHGTYPAEYEKYVDLFGAGEGAWVIGRAQLRELLLTGDADRALGLAEFIMAKYPSPRRVGKIHEALQRATKTYQLGRDIENRLQKPFDIMSRTRAHYSGWAEWYYRELHRRVDKSRRLALLFRLQETFNAPLSTSTMRIFGTMRELPTEEARLAAGGRYLALEAIYRDHPQPWAYREYLSVLFESPQVFAIKDKVLVPPGEAQKKFEALKARHTGGTAQLHGHMHNIQRHFLPEEEKAPFLEKHFSILSPGLVRELILRRNREGYEDILKRAAEGRSYNYFLGLQYYALEFHNQAGNKEKLIEAARDYMSGWPGSFSGSHVLSHFFRSEAVGLDEKVALLNEIHDKGGYSKPLLDLSERLSRERAWAAEEGLAELKAALEEKRPGTDPFMSAQVRMHLLSGPRDERAPKALEICTEFLKHREGEVPASWRDTASREDVIGLDLFHRHLDAIEHRDHVNGRPFAELWGPRLSLGDAWGSLAERVRHMHRSSDMLYDLGTHYLALLGDDGAGSRRVWSVLAVAANPAERKDLLFADHYEDMGLDLALDYVRRQEHVLGPEGVIAGLDDIVARPGFAFRDTRQVRDVIGYLNWRTGGAIKPPDRLTAAAWQRFLAIERETGEYEPYTEQQALRIYARAGQVEEVQRHWQDYKGVAAERRLTAQIAGLATTYGYLPREEKGKLAPGHRYHVVLKVLKPLYEKLPATDWPACVVTEYVLEDLLEMTQWQDEQISAEARSLTALLAEILAGGARYRGYGRHPLNTLTGVVQDALEQGQWDRAARLAQFLAIRLRWTDDWNWINNACLQPVIRKAEDVGAHEIAYVFVDRALRENRPSENVAKILAIARARAGRAIPDLIPVAKNDPTYNLHIASRSLALGNESRAWQLTAPKMAMLTKVWTDLEPDYVAWCVEQMRKQKLLKEGLALAFAVLLREQDLGPEVAARLMLAKGDIYRDMQNYQAARTEYEALRSNRLYQDTAAGSRARYSLISLHILTRNFDQAERLLERMVDSENIETQANAYYYYARVAFDRAEYQQARQYLNNVFKRQHDHQRARLLEGELRLFLPRGLETTEVAVGSPHLQTVAIPGRALRMKLHDTNLSIARGATAIPVVVKTDPSGDEERIRLHSSPTDQNLFVGSIPTKLGDVRQGNFVLEIGGEDTVSYEIDSVFQEENDLDYPPKVLDVRSDARLAASSGEILSEEEEERRALQRRLQPALRPGWEQREEQSRTVRPGSPIYAQVTDMDRDVSGQPDTVPIALRTTSGDLLEDFMLVETGPHTGIFTATVPTGMPFPKASASDTDEGIDPNAVINTTKEGVWRSLPDGKKPKWFMVDTMDSHLVKEAVIEVEGAEQVRRLVLMGMLADDFIEIAAYPKGSVEVGGGATVAVIPARTSDKAWDIRSYLRGPGAEKHWQASPAYERKWKEGETKRDGWRSFRLRGMFFMSESRMLDLRFVHTPSPHGWQHAYLFIDGELVLGGRITQDNIARVRPLTLLRGPHELEIVGCDHYHDSAVTVGYRTETGEFEPLPETWFSVRESKELAEYLKPRGVISVEGDRIVTGFDKPVRLRRLRWVFDDFTGNAVTVRSISVLDDKGKAILPVATDFALGTQNRRLEIAPGDRIEVVYNDEKRLREGEPELTETLGASYCNGEIGLANEVINYRGRTGSEWRKAKRCRVGDQLAILVADYDLDVTDERDVLQVMVTTSAGEELVLKALETMPTNRYDDPHGHAGFFFAVLQIGDETGKNTIKAEPDDQITVHYLDQENTLPGVPYERSYAVTVTGGGKPAVVVYQTGTVLVEDRRPQARARLERLRATGQIGGDEALYREQIVARHPGYPQREEDGLPARRDGPGDEAMASVGAPLMFQVQYPQAALHEGSVYVLKATSESEMKAAAAANREPATVEVPVVVTSLKQHARDKGYDVRVLDPVIRTPEQMLEDGLFTGVIHLQMGSPGDPVDDLVVLPQDMFRASDPDEEIEENRVPTLIVSGADVVHIVAEDIGTGETYTTDIRLLSDARLRLMERTHTVERKKVHVGDRFYVRVDDPDNDLSEERDVVTVQVKSSEGENLTIELTETLPHSGIFTGTLRPRFNGDGENGEPAGPDVLDVDFGDDVLFTYGDERSLSSAEPVEVQVEGRIHFGSDGKVAVFTKRFKDPEMAVKTRFLMAEALFEMAKEHRKLGQDVQADEEIARGKRILEEALQDYPNTSLAAHGEFLLANLAQELGHHEEAISRYTSIIRIWPDSEFAPRSQFKKGICLEKIENFDEACEQYVRLTYLYPGNSLVPDATLRLANYYYKDERYDVAGKIFARFQAHHPDHGLASRALFLAAQCQTKLEDYKAAIDVLEQLIIAYPDDKDVRAEAMYWVGDAYHRLEDYKEAYRALKKLTWDYPTTKWAKIARGRLTEEVFEDYSEE